MHADGQYSPEALPLLVDEMPARGLDVLQGSRIASGTALSGGMPIYKYAANAVLNRIENHTLGSSMTDYHSGYLLYGRRALRALPFRAFPTASISISRSSPRARARGLRVGEAPVPTHYGDEVSHLNPITYGLRVLACSGTTAEVAMSPREVVRAGVDDRGSRRVSAAVRREVSLARRGDRMPATHAEVRTLNDGYDRRTSHVLVRRDRSPHARNPRLRRLPRQFHDRRSAARAAMRRPSAPATPRILFGARSSKETLTGDVKGTPLTDAERSHPLAFAPAVEFLQARTSRRRRRARGARVRSARRDVGARARPHRTAEHRRAFVHPTANGPGAVGQDRIRAVVQGARRSPRSGR